MTHLPDSDLRELEGLLRQAYEAWRADTDPTPGPFERLAADAFAAGYRCRHASLIADLRETRERIKRLETGYSKMNEEVCQVLGKALGYPWFKDDPKNFPNATEANGVCVGEHVAESLADAAAARIKELEGKT